MGEIDTNPIESVQTALSLFGEKGDLLSRKNRSTGSDDEKERELENVLKDLSNYKVQLEAKEAAYMQVLLELEHTRKSSKELSTLLNNIDSERERYETECREARARIHELESATKEMADQLSESTKSHEQLPFVLLDLEAMREELVSREADLAAVKESETKAMMQVETMGRELRVDREKSEELEKRASKLDDTVCVSEREKNEILLEKDVENGSVKEAMKREMEERMKLENQLLLKSILVDTLELQIREANEQLSLSTKSASDAIANFNLLRDELEISERKISSREALIEAFKMEVTELKSAKGETQMSDLQKEDESWNIASSEASKNRAELESLRKELESAEAKVAEMRNRAEQANCRAEIAEKAKTAIEDQLRKWREERQKQKLARAALREISEPKVYNVSETDDEKPTQPTRYQPLYKVLNMKF